MPVPAWFRPKDGQIFGKLQAKHTSLIVAGISLLFWFLMHLTHVVQLNLKRSEIPKKYNMPKERTTALDGLGAFIGFVFKSHIMYDALATTACVLVIAAFFRIPYIGAPYVFSALSAMLYSLHTTVTQIAMLVTTSTRAHREKPPLTVPIVAIFWNFLMSIVFLALGFVATLVVKAVHIAKGEKAK
ncbi:hypothetical protein QR680_012108 [Steinernema hermaphroditum]|uniref:Uncharacterized protein n=1 Tax=Steinernema hermaphroditum TaxID=289476 RepID=A0AA39LZZ3_9BILA|nr:hypothetical protein QR680_012108 [Steinernema hermaphroditum]